MDGKRKRKSAATGKGRRSYDPEFRQEAVRMLLDGHSAKSVAENLGLSGTNVLYRWKAKLLKADQSNAQVRPQPLRALRLLQKIRRARTAFRWRLLSS